MVKKKTQRLLGITIWSLVSIDMVFFVYAGYEILLSGEALSIFGFAIIILAIAVLVQSIINVTSAWRRK